MLLGNSWDNSCKKFDIVDFKNVFFELFFRDGNCFEVYKDYLGNLFLPKVSRKKNRFQHVPFSRKESWDFDDKELVYCVKITPW